MCPVKTEENAEEMEDKRLNSASIWQITKNILNEYDRNKGILRKISLFRRTDTPFIAQIRKAHQDQNEDLLRDAILKISRAEVLSGKIWDNFHASQTGMAWIKLAILLGDKASFALIQSILGDNASCYLTPGLEKKEVSPSEDMYESLSILFGLSKRNMFDEKLLAIFLSKNRDIFSASASLNEDRKITAYPLLMFKLVYRGNTALLWAIANNSCDAAIALIKNMDAEAMALVDNGGKNALHFAIAKGREHKGSFKNQMYRAIGTGLKATMNDVIKEILHHPNIQNFINNTMSDGNTALHLAYMRNDIPLIEALKKAGADETIKNSEGRTPAEMERIISHEDTVHYMGSLTEHTSTVSKTHKKL